MKMTKQQEKRTKTVKDTQRSRNAAGWTRPVVVLLLGALVVVCVTGFFVQDEANLLFRIHRGITTFGKVYEEIAVNYVDDIDPDGFLRAGIDGMLRTLDPYTTYVGEEESDELELVTSGRYGGIGVTIGIRDGAVTIVNLMDGYSAAKRGIEMGDRVLEVDAKPVSGMSLESIRLLVRGTPGSEIRLKIERDGESAPLEFVLIREDIPVRNVTYTGYVADGIGLIRLERFSRTAGEDVRTAIRDLQKTGTLNGLVLDVRDNPGGLLDIAVDIVSKFVPESTLVVSTRGRRSDSERKYFSTETPMVPDLPLVVLTNRTSASASEIVAGAVQDVDRGVIVGTRTFGKGLVQTISRLSETASLKMTTARYYTPSGRCIQELDYWHRDGNGKETVKPDSMRKAFFTSRKRPVLDAGGIVPDSTVVDTVRVPYLDALTRKAMFFKYAKSYVQKNGAVTERFAVTDAMIEDFESFIRGRGFDYQEDAERELGDLRKAATAARYGKPFIDQLDKMEVELKEEKERQIHRFHEEVRVALMAEILGMVKGERGRIEATFPSDKQLQTAVGILKNKKRYEAILAGR